MKKIDFVIIGGQKSGSTFIQEVVAEHPQVFMPEGEVSYLEDPDYQQQGMKKLWQLFAGQDQAKTWGIKRPNLLGCAECPERIDRELDSPRLLAILRDPVERALSAYFHYVKDGFLPLLPIEEGMQQILDGKLQKKYPRSVEILNFGYNARHLRQYLKYFDRERMLVLLYDQLRKDKEGTIRQVYRFLGVDENFVPVRSMHTTPQKVVYSIPRQRILRLRNNHKWSYNADRTRLEFKEQSLLDKGICKLIEKIDEKLLSRMYASEKPGIPEGIKRQLYHVYKNDIAELEHLLGADLSRWKRLENYVSSV